MFIFSSSRILPSIPDDNFRLDLRNGDRVVVTLRSFVFLGSEMCNFLAFCDLKMIYNKFWFNNDVAIYEFI